MNKKTKSYTKNFRSNLAIPALGISKIIYHWVLMAPETAFINQSKEEFLLLCLDSTVWIWLLSYPLTLENPVQVLQSFIDVI